MHAFIYSIPHLYGLQSPINLKVYLKFYVELATIDKDFTRIETERQASKHLLLLLQQKCNDLQCKMSVNLSRQKQQRQRPTADSGACLAHRDNNNNNCNAQSQRLFHDHDHVVDNDV